MMQPQPTAWRDRTFKMWEFQVGHKQLLIRSPKAPATLREPERFKNIDLVCIEVEYMAVPCVLRGLDILPATETEMEELAALLGKRLPADAVRILESGGHRFPIVAFRFTISENDWDIFDSPFEFRSHYWNRAGNQEDKDPGMTNT